MEGELHFLDQIAGAIVEAIDFAALSEIPDSAAIRGRSKAVGEVGASEISLPARTAPRLKKSQAA